jgi:hypothetical protein
MPGVDNTFLKKLKASTVYPCFIETGTNLGNTVIGLEPYFRKLHTIELSEKYYIAARSKYTGSKINFIFGDSSSVFKTLLPTITDNCIFFLDAHWCGLDTGRSENDCPLNEEITQINMLFRHDAILIIDDFRLFGLDKSSGKLCEDWSNINKENILRILGQRVSKVYHLDSEYAKNDRLIIHINKL